jgi:hypothetical protein
MRERREGEKEGSIGKNASAPLISASERDGYFAYGWIIRCMVHLSAKLGASRLALQCLRQLVDQYLSALLTLARIVEFVEEHSLLSNDELSPFLVLLELDGCDGDGDSNVIDVHLVCVHDSLV